MSRPIEPPRQCLVRSGVGVCNLEASHAATSYIHVDIRDGRVYAEWSIANEDDLLDWNRAPSHPAGPRIYTIGEALEAVQRTHIGGTPNRDVTR
jgi:hypothetical protein